MIKVNTEKGQALLDACRDRLELEKVEAERMDACHPGMGNPAMRHPLREKFREHLDDLPIDRLLRKYAVLPVKMRMRLTAVKVLKRWGLYELLRSLRHRG